MTDTNLHKTIYILYSAILALCATGLFIGCYILFKGVLYDTIRTTICP